MKKLIFLIALVGSAAMISCGTTSSAAKSEVDRIAAEQVSVMLGEKVYKMDFNRAYPTSAPPFSLNYPYFVSVIRDRVESFLPYFGRAYSIPYGGGEGLHFDAPISNYKVVTGKKDKKIVTFDARTAEDNYQFRIEIYPTGETNLSVGASQRQSMSFSGHIDLDAEFELMRIEE